MAGFGARLRRTIVLLLATLLATTSLAGCSETKVTSAELSLPVIDGSVLALLDPGAERPPGTTSLAGALAAALPAAEVVETPTHDEQDARVRAAADAGVAILLVQAIDAERIGSALSAAAKTDMLVVAVGVIPHDFGSIDLFIGWDEFSAGEQEVAAFARAVGIEEGRTKYLELLAGDESDLGARARFHGALFALKAFTEQGTLSVKSGRTSFETAAVDPGDVAAARKALGTTYAVTYPRHELQGVIIPTDDLAPMVRELADEHDQPAPLLMSSGASAAGITELMAGTLLTTMYRDPATLAGRIADAVTTLQAGDPVTVNPQGSRRNRLKRKPALLVPPVLVSADNAAAVLADNPELAPLTKA
ncbi:substrate-binding domain-containing protein [Aestuariimicrobium sp. Y1814]|uniref:substrate-binding domain-containing protein n=1 Tax=Aestuariimicrobium sp. Y1814 TaxID=3418742 RepID=UPI003DA77E9D